MKEIREKRLFNIYGDFGTGMAGNVWDSDYIAPTLSTMQGGGRQPMIVQKIPQMVKVRKYEIDTHALSELLRSQKKKCGITNKDIADQLNQPITLVEHWFRKDDSSAIPSAEIWSKLKQVLNMEDDCEYDEAILSYDSRVGVYDKAERCYDEDGISPTIDASTKGEKIITRNKRLEKLIDKTQFEEGKVLDLDLYNQSTNEQVSSTLSDPCHNTNRLFDGMRIRKLTPLETWRLMGQSDEAYYKARAVNSDTQLYKQAGNSIVVDVLFYLVKSLLEQNE